MNNDLLKGVIKPLNWAQPLGKPPYLIKPVEVTPTFSVKGALQGLADFTEALQNAVLGMSIALMRVLDPRGYRDYCIARAFPTWGKRNRMLKVLALPAPLLCVMCNRQPRTGDYYCRDCFEAWYCGGMESDE